MKSKASGVVALCARANGRGRYVDGWVRGVENTGTMSINESGFLRALVVSALVVVFGTPVPQAGAQSTAAQAEKAAKQALDTLAVSAFDASLKYAGQEMIARPVNGSTHEIMYTIEGPGPGEKGTVQYRIYDNPAAAAAHADPDLDQQRQEASENDTPHGQFRTYHSNLSGSALAQDVPQTFHCRALANKGSWSRCYYYAGGESDIVVVGTTNSTQANEAIMITAMGAQGLAEKK